jgi:hypothetical protein
VRLTLPPAPPPSHSRGMTIIVARVEARRLRLTDLRRRVFVEIAGSHHAVSAYDVLERLAKTKRKRAAMGAARLVTTITGLYPG